MKLFKLLCISASCLALAACADLRQNPSTNTATTNQPTATAAPAANTAATNVTNATPITEEPQVVSADASTSTPKQGLPTWEQRYSELKQINSWSLNGSVSVRQGGKTNIASLNWNQQQQHYYNLAISGPMSVGRVNISGSGNSVSMTRGGKTATASSAEQLMQQQLGWGIPVSSMYYWVRGIPAPGAKPRMNFDNENRLAQLSQEGWVINYQGYENVRGLELPRVITFLNPRMNIRLVVRGWNV